MHITRVRTTFAYNVFASCSLGRKEDNISRQNIKEFNEEKKMYDLVVYILTFGVVLSMIEQKHNLRTGKPTRSIRTYQVAHDRIISEA
jgi:hypothetical protein